MPENIRVASATVLDNIFKDAGVAQQDPRLAVASRVEALEPGPSTSAWHSSQMVAGGAGDGNNNLVGLTSSSLDVLQHQLTRPTKEQEEEQLFSLTADQYNGVVSPDAFGEPESMSMSHGPQGDFGLTAMRVDNHHKNSAAEVYTRSLLWEKVPAEVVRDFAKFVADSAAHDERQKAAN